MKELNKRERFFIIFCALFILFFSGYKFVYLGLVQSYRYNRIKIDTLETKYFSHTALAAQANNIQKNLTGIRSELKKVESRFFPREKDSLVAAQIQQNIEQICMENGIKVQRSRVLKSEEMGSYKKINVQVLIEGSITALNQIVFALKNSQKYFFIPEIEIRVTNRKNPTTIRTTMTVSGIMRI